MSFIKPLPDVTVFEDAQKPIKDTLESHNHKKRYLLTPKKHSIQKCPGAPLKKRRCLRRSRPKPRSAERIFAKQKTSQGVDQLISELMKYTL